MGKDKQRSHDRRGEQDAPEQREQGRASFRGRAKKAIGPGKVTRTSTWASTEQPSISRSIQRKEAPVVTNAPVRSGKTTWEWTMSPYIDTALRGTPLPDAQQTQQTDPVQCKPVYRGMIESGGSPALGESARKLGVRVGPDLDVKDDIAKHNKKGMSTSPDDPKNLPKHRRPKEFGGTGKDPVWEIDSGQLSTETIEWHQDSATHGIVRPTKDMPYKTFKSALEATQGSWSKAAPQKSEESGESKEQDKS